MYNLSRHSALYVGCTPTSSLTSLCFQLKDRNLYPVENTGGREAILMVITGFSLKIIFVLGTKLPDTRTVFTCSCSVGSGMECGCLTHWLTRAVTDIEGEEGKGGVSSAYCSKMILA